MGKTWIPWVFETFPGGASSAVAPELLPPGQTAWMMNMAIRGAKPHTRPPIVERMVLPAGLHQSSGYFGVQGGMIISNIHGRIYRLRIGNNTFSWEEIPLNFVNSGIIKQTWMQQTIESLVIQDGQSTPIIYNGSTARRAGSDEVPRGKSMAYGNGRLWVAINERELVAGDIRTRTPGSELKFTETNYLSGGGSLYFSRGITGLEFIPVTGAADFGTLIVFGRDYAESIRADVTSRDMWAQMAGFVTNVFRDIGCAGDWSITQVNQDLYWRDSHGDIRSLANAISTNNSPGSTPISREVSRIVDFDSDQLLPWVSAIYFDNRLLMTASPYLNVNAGVSFKDIVSLDFSPISTMRLKAPPAYDGTWTGIPGAAQLVTGEFDGMNRAFAISSGEDGVNRLWEILTRGREDAWLTCGTGSLSPIESLIEYPSINFGLQKQRKRIERCDVWLSGIDGDLEITAFWRTDNAQQWIEWDSVPTCAKTTDAAVNTPHTWKNLLTEQRPQIKTFTIPDGVDAVTRYALQVGFEFQIRLVITGKCQIEKMMIYGTPLDDPDYANRETLVQECLENNVTGNEIVYRIPACRVAEACMSVSPTSVFSSSGDEGNSFSPLSRLYSVFNFGNEPMQWAVSVDQPWMLTDGSGGTLEAGQGVQVLVSFDEEQLQAFTASGSPYTGTISFTNVTNGCGDTTRGALVLVASSFFNQTISFEQFDGPFEYPDCAYVFGNAYYRTQTATGINQVKWAPTAGSVQLRTCSLTDPPAAYGITKTVWSGLVFQPLDCAGPVGTINVELTRSGSLGAYDSPGVPGVVTLLSSTTVEGAFALLFASGGAFISGRYDEFTSDDLTLVTKQWSSPSEPQGYFSGSFGGPFDSIYCPYNTMSVTLSDRIMPEDLGIPVARSGPVGSAAQTQTTGFFDSGTRTNLGNFSRAIISVGVDASRSQLTGDFFFDVTPDVGAPYQIHMIRDFPISGSTVNATINYPMIAEATVILSSWSYSYQKSLSEDFESYDAGDTIILLPPSPSWSNQISFDAPAPNTDCWDDIENFAEGVLTQISVLSTGERWAAQATFSSVDYVDLYDDFEGYAAGDTTSFGQGIGWNGIGATFTINYGFCYDDLESYATGAITVFDFTSTDNLWNGDGSVG